MAIARNLPGDRLLDGRLRYPANGPIGVFIENALVFSADGLTLSVTRRRMGSDRECVVPVRPTAAGSAVF